YNLQDLSDPLQAINTLLVKEQQATETTQQKTATNELAQQLQQNNEEATEKKSPTTVSPLFSLLKSGYNLTYAVADTLAINQIFARKDVQALLPHNLRFLWDVKPNKLEDGTAVLTLYPIKNQRGKALLEGDVITDARNAFDERGKAAVNMQMNSVGARAWKRVTANNIDKQIAIVLDDQVYSAPAVKQEIPNGYSVISGNFTIEEAKDLANILKSGSLPAPVKIVEEVMIGPTLGKEAQAQGVRSMLLGLGVVLLFMLLYYAKGGIIANVALLFNILFILGVLAQLNAALTLPGIAGIVLTIGMAIDANVLIFERIREELNNGVNLRNAIINGYQKASSSIIDANVTTFLIGVILYLLGQGPVRGFATTLMIGIVSSFFAAVFITRVIVTWLANRGKETKLTFSFSFTRHILTNLNVDF
ncbi:MAG: protein translocase subunit SecD, partial [Bacteroidota bacterium]